MITSGSIPKKIYYVYASPTQIPVGSSWDIDSKIYPQENISQTMVVDAEYAVAGAKSQLERQARWQNLTTTVTADQIDNLPISDIKVLSIGYSTSGIVFKAQINNYCVQILGDTMMDSILANGIKLGGILKGKFIWGKLHSKLRLIRIGSEVHKQLVEFEKRKTLKVIGKNDLQVGGVYLNLRKQPAIFLGYVGSTKYYMQDRDKPLDFFTTSVKKGMLFLTYDKDEKPQVALDTIQNKFNYTWRYIKFRQSHTYLEKIDDVIVSPNTISQIRKHYFDKAVKDISEFGAVRNGLDLAWRLSSYAELFNMYAVGSEPVKILDAQKYLAFV